jgi:SAM-dependent methyltransferase
MDLKEEASLVGDACRHWYYRSKLAAVARLVAPMGARSLLDVGSGSGFFARELLRRTAMAEATCVDIGYGSDGDEDVGGKPLRFRRANDGTRADLVLMMDVLEHVPNDAALVAEYAASASPGTRFLATVPAFSWLWSGHDVFLGHYRRYTVTQLEQALGRGGVRVDGGCYFYGGVLPAAAASRAVGRLTGRGKLPRSQMASLPGPLDAALGAVCRAELPFFAKNRLGGLTAMAWGTVPARGDGPSP